MKGDNGSFHYFTGSMGVDKQNTSGLGVNSMIACFAVHNQTTNIQSYGISYSNDHQYFNYYISNPVIDISSKEFRDPQVFC